MPSFLGKQILHAKLVQVLGHLARDHYAQGEHDHEGKRGEPSLEAH